MQAGKSPTLTKTGATRDQAYPIRNKKSKSIGRLAARASLTLSNSYKVLTEISWGHYPIIREVPLSRICSSP